MKHIKRDNGLLITVDAEEMAELLLMRLDEPEKWGTSNCEGEIMERFMANSGFEWIDPSETGDLTDAPMIGSRDEDGNVLERYAFMNYAVRSFLDDLADDGGAFFHGGLID